MREVTTQGTQGTQETKIHTRNFFVQLVILVLLELALTKEGW
jgi:hypothetical protein